MKIHNSLILFVQNLNKIELIKETLGLNNMKTKLINDLIIKDIKYLNNGKLKQINGSIRINNIKENGISIRNSITIIIVRFIIININEKCILLHLSNINDFSRVIYGFIFFIEYSFYFIYKTTYHNAINNNKLFISYFQRNINNIFNSLIKILHYDTINLSHDKKPIKNKLYAQIISLIDNNIFIYNFDIINAIINITYINLKRIEDSKRFVRNLKNDIGFYDLNNISNIIYKIKEYDKLKKSNIKLNEKGEENKKDNTLKNIIKNRNYILIFLIKSLILINIFNGIQNKNSKIYLNIKGISQRHILGHLFRGNNYLNKIYINGYSQEISNKNIYNLNESNNYVELIWNDNLDNCDYLFHAGNEITKIDLSNFDTSNVKSMQGMFYGCSSLTSLNLTNFDTSNVINMDAMFQYCSSLTSLDLSYFKTSNVKNMGSMFLYCSSLTSLDLSNFIASNVEDMSNMFADCHNLKYINLNYFNEY